MNADLRLRSHREAAAELARDHQTVGELAESRLSNRSAEKQEVVPERNPTQPRLLPRQRQRNERERGENVEELCENEAQCSIGRVEPIAALQPT